MSFNLSAFAPLGSLLNQLPFNLGGSISDLSSSFSSSTINNNATIPLSTGPSTGGGATCISQTIPLTINTTGTKLLYTPPEDNAGVTNTFVRLFQAGSTFGQEAFAGGPSTIAGTFNIFTKFCTPPGAESQSQSTTLQILSHGGTLDHTYWDISPGHSYVDAAAAAGYATLSFDQLGVGLSAHPDPFQTVQATSQVAILHALIQHVRSSGFAGLTFDKIVGVAHSAGSALTQAITTQYPADFDAVILSGTSTDASNVPLTMAAMNLINANTDTDPSGISNSKLKSLPTGYLTQQSAAGIQFAFYRYPNYDAEAFRRQVENKATNTLGVLLTLGMVVAPSLEFEGPVAVVNGENDLVFCGGYCRSPVDQSEKVLEVFYPKAGKGSGSFVVEGAGHSIAAHKSGPESFKHMIGFLKGNGL